MSAVDPLEPKETKDSLSFKFLINFVYAFCIVFSVAVLFYLVRFIVNRVRENKKAKIGQKNEQA